MALNSHILFIDPLTGLLCLGTDAPVGGPTKLSRNFWFKGPPGQGSPICYASGADMSSGVRVVAAFGTKEEQSIWFVWPIVTDGLSTFTNFQSPGSIPSLTMFLVPVVHYQRLVLALCYNHIQEVKIPIWSGCLGGQSMGCKDPPTIQQIRHYYQIQFGLSKLEVRRLVIVQT